MNEFPPCAPGEPVTVCCMTQTPNTSEWQVVCPRTNTQTNVPALTQWGGLLFAALLIAVAMRRLR